MEARDSEQRLAAIASLREPARAAVYRYVTARSDLVGRDEVASALGLARSVAAFNLDKLVEAGLLETEFRRRAGRSGPGAGRPAKLYRRSGTETNVSVPERRYDLAGQLLAGGVVRAEAEGSPPAAAARYVAHDHGVALGIRSKEGLGRKRAGLAELAAALADEGYEPRLEDGALVLANCPFHSVAEAQRELVCGMNLALVEGMVEGMEAKRLMPRLRPVPGRCCVVIEGRDRSSAGG